MENISTSNLKCTNYIKNENLLAIDYTTHFPLYNRSRDQKVLTMIYTCNTFFFERTQHAILKYLNLLSMEYLNLDKLFLLLDLMTTYTHFLGLV